MGFFAIYWPAFLAALSANLITVIVVYACILSYQGHSAGTALTKAGQTLILVSWRAVQIYIGIMFLGALAYMAKIIVFDGIG